MNILNALKGTGGEFEINRVMGAAGTTAYIGGTHAFLAFNPDKFDLIAYCAAFPGGLGVCVGAIAGAVAVKDRNVASAKATEADTKTRNTE